MVLLPHPSMIFHLIIYCCLCIGGRAIDCGGNQIANTIVVDHHGGGAFNRIQAAIDSIKHYNDRWIKILINPGIYVETVYIPFDKPCIYLVGTGGLKNTIITNGDNKIPTFFSQSTNIILHGITFKNTYGTNEAANAAIIYGDKSAIISCGFIGYQDTLMDGNGRHYFRNCYIQGEVDFIYGEAQSYYENCVIIVRQDSSKPSGFITAQRRNSTTESTGFVFRGGRVDGIGKVLLGRAWGPYSRVIFWGTYLSSVILPQGWDAWNFVGHENNLVYAEVDCTGPGSNTQGRVNWEKKPNEININDYSLSTFVNQDGWLNKLPPIPM